MNRSLRLKVSPSRRRRPREQMSKDMLAKDEENQEMRQALARLRAQVAPPAEGVPEV